VAQGTVWGDQVSEEGRTEILGAFNDIAQYFSKKEWEKMKFSEKIIYVYMKINYEAMTKLDFKVTLPPFMHNKRATDFQGNDFDNDHNGGNQVERPQMTFSKLQRILPKVNVSQILRAREPLSLHGCKHCLPNPHFPIFPIIGPKRGKHTWTHRLRERKQLVIYEEISDPEEDDE
uniref:KRAB-related domain-containing protein n=1 Tax=Macaca nemestrina TaxID=9545 RepID=A0A2K6E7H7_MACNE